MTAKLFSPFTLKGLILKNRVVMPPMCMYSSEKEDGMVNNWHLTHYVSRAVGQVGLIIVEATAVTPQGRISNKDLGIWNDEHIEGLAKLSRLVKEHGTKIGIQIAHAGRKSGIDGNILAPSAIPFEENAKVPNEMSKTEIKDTIEAFKQAAKRAKQAGFDVIEIHGAHGYLIHEFLSPLSNQRMDEYGGSVENRYRFLKEVISAVKTVWEGPLMVRISATDYHPDGLAAEDHVKIARSMKEQGVDLIDVSTGGLVSASINLFPGYQVKFSEVIKHQADIPTGAVGLITSGLHAEEILQNDRADLILIGRELLRDPYWPRTAAKQLGVEIISPQPYERGWNK